METIRIAISGKSGCGNTTVSRLLAQRLGIELINYTFHTMADEQGVSFEEMCRMAEEDDKWDLHLDEEQVKRARAGSCVLASRLAIWLLEEADLKVYLWASREVRASRIHQREGGAYHEILQTTEARDKRDQARYLRLYEIDVDTWDFADLVIDTEQYRPEQIVEQIVGTLKQ